MIHQPEEALPAFSAYPEEPPRRVISLVPSITESLFDLALGDRVVGVTEYCIHPAGQLAALPRVGGPKTPDIPHILALEPDVVMMNREENRLEDAEALHAAGVRVWATQPATVQEAINLLWDIMEVFDEPAMVERVRWIERQMDWTLGATANLPPVRVFVPIWYQPWMTISSTAYAHDVLRICGGINVFAAHADSAYPAITLEDIEASQPEIVLLPDEPFKFEPEHAQELSRLDIPAARHHRIYHCDGSYLTWHGTRVARAFSEIAPLLAPDFNRAE
ncbi:MAG: ABC transporter substrate-binding protein [Anaerolineae bacterium]|nr:ABC transporter substrate-binding protein [Anaerolineae bacterium]